MTRRKRFEIHTSTIDALLGLMRDTDPLVRMRAADALEKASREDPEILMPHKHSLLSEIAEDPQQEVRWHLLQMLPRLRLTPSEGRRAFEIAANSLPFHLQGPTEQIREAARPFLLPCRRHPLAPRSGGADPKSFGLPADGIRLGGRNAPQGDVPARGVAG